MIEKLPQKFSFKWFGIYIASLFISGIIIYAAITLASRLTGQQLFDFNMLNLFFFVAITNFLVSMFGFLNGKYLFVLSGLALLAGTFSSAILVTEDYNGWEYFSGIMSLVLYFLFGIVIGILAECVIAIKKKKMSYDNGNKEINWPSILFAGYLILLSVPIIIYVLNFGTK